MNYTVVDVECAGLEARQDPSVSVWCVGFYTPDSGAFTLPLGAAIEYINERPDMTWVFHNAAFDVPVLRTRGAVLNHYHDTQVMAYVLDTQQDVSLDGLALKHLGVGKVDLATELYEHGVTDTVLKPNDLWQLEFTDKALELLCEYCKRDCEVTGKLYELLTTQLAKDERLWNAYDSVERPFIEVVIEMEATGFYIDRPYLQEFDNELEQREQQLLQSLSAMVPAVPSITFSDGEYQVVPKTYAKGYYKRHGVCTYDHCELNEFNPNSADQLAYVLITKHNWKPKATTASGKPATDVYTLEHDASLNGNELVSQYLELSKVTKLRGTFVKALLEGSEQDGFCRAGFNQTVTKTTRLSSSKPNAQNIAAHGDDSTRLRQSFTAPEGYVLCVSDFSQFELRILAYYLEAFASESRMADSVRSGLDLNN